MNIEDTNTELKDNNNTISNKSVATSESGKKGTFAVLHIVNFDYLLTGSFMMSGVQWIQTVIINWLVYDLTRSGTMLGTVNLISTIASVGMVLATGTLIDYFNRRKLMLIETSIVLVAMLALGLILFSGHRLIIFVVIFSFIYGMTSSLDSTARQVLVFDLVPRTQTPNAMALIQTGWSVMRVAGPMIGGFLLIWFGTGGDFFILAGVTLITLITIIQMKVPARKRPAIRSNPLANVRDGMAFIFTDRITRTFTIVQLVLGLVIIPIYSILPPIYAGKVFHDETGVHHVLAYLLASVGVGGIIGGIVAVYLKRWEFWGRLQLASLLGCSLGLLAFALSTSFPLALGMLMLSGFFESIFLVTNATLIQLSIPDKIRGRVTAALNLSYIVSPLGSLIAGAGADWLGPKGITIVLSIILASGLILAYIASSTIRNYRLSQAKDNIPI